MRLLTKAEACRELEPSLCSLNRRIAAGDASVRREQRSRRHRVYVIVDDDLRGTARRLNRRWSRPGIGFPGQKSK